MKDRKVAVLMLACRDFRALELSLACHMAYGDPDVPFFALQNCRGGYDAERSLHVLKRYEALYPSRLRIIDDQPPAPPYRAIADALASERFAPFDLVCKVDDDSFPIAPGWLEGLLACWSRNLDAPGGALAYVTPLINNNNWGFAATIRALGLEADYFAKVARDHYVGAGDVVSPLRIVPRDEIVTGANGTIWASPHIARWLHGHTTLQPDRFIAATRGLPDMEVPGTERYSIGCILFRKELWTAIDDGGLDDEHMLRRHCTMNGLRIVANPSVPFVHLAYYPQREENRDIVEKAIGFYEERLGLPFPIGLHQSPLLEIEARLRWAETRQIGGSGPEQSFRPNEAPHLGKRIEQRFRSFLRQVGPKRPPR